MLSSSSLVRYSTLRNIRSSTSISLLRIFSSFKKSSSFSTGPGFLSETCGSFLFLFSTVPSPRVGFLSCHLPSALGGSKLDPHHSPAAAPWPAFLSSDDASLPLAATGCACLSVTTADTWSPMPDVQEILSPFFQSLLSRGGTMLRMVALESLAASSPRAKKVFFTSSSALSPS